MSSTAIRIQSASQDNTNDNTNPIGAGGLSFLGRFLVGGGTRRHSAAMMLQHVTVARNDLAMDDVELVPTLARTPDVTTLPSLGMAQRISGMFRGMRTLR